MRRALLAAPVSQPVTREAFMLTKRVRRLLGVAAVSPLLLTSCDNNPFDPFEEAEGTYELTVFAGYSMPGAEFPCGSGRCRVTGGTLTLYDDGTFVERNQWVDTPTGGTPQTITYTSAGTYTLNGEDLTLSDPFLQRFVNATLVFTSTGVRINYFEDNGTFEYIRD
jgi:hypothetical protein